jgi:membrane protein
MKAMVERAKRLMARAMATVPGRIIQRFGQDQAPNAAVLIAWNLLLSFFPIVLALAAILGLLLGQMGIATRAQFEATMLSQLPTQTQDTRAALDAIKQQTGVFFVVGLLGLTWSGSALFGAMEQAFDAIYRLAPRDFIHQKVMGVLMMLLFAGVAVLLILSSSALSLLQSLPLVPEAVVAAGPVLSFIQPLVGIAAGLLLFGAMYFVVPNRRMHVREVWPGTLLAGVAFYLLSLVFPLYLTYLGRGMNQYGKSLSLLFILMTWAYFVGLIVMLGAELNVVLAAPRIEAPAAHPARRAPAPPAAAEPPIRARSKLRRGLYVALGAAIGMFAAIRHGRRAA